MHLYSRRQRYLFLLISSPSVIACLSLTIWIVVFQLPYWMILDDLLKTFKKHSHNTRGARGDTFKYPKNENLFLWFQISQVKSIKEWNNIIDKIHFIIEDFMKHWVYQKNKKYPSLVKLPLELFLKTSITSYLSAFIKATLVDSIK